jgi:hypothetical protein
MDRRWQGYGRIHKKSARLIGTPIEQNDREVCALLLSEKLAKRIREALCITQEFRLYRNEVKEQNGTINARQIDCDAWASSIKYSIQLLKEEIKRTGKASRDQRLELETLLKEERRVQKNDEDLQKARKKMEDVLSGGLEKWIKAWMEVDRMLNVVWTSADIIKQPQLATLRITRSSQSPPPDFQRPEQPPRTNASRPRDRGRDHDQIEHAGSRNRDSSRDQRRRTRSREDDGRDQRGNRQSGGEDRVHDQQPRVNSREHHRGLSRSGKSGSRSLRQERRNGGRQRTQQTYIQPADRIQIRGRSPIPQRSSQNHARPRQIDARNRPLNAHPCRDDDVERELTRCRSQSPRTLHWGDEQSQCPHDQHRFKRPEPLRQADRKRGPSRDRSVRHELPQDIPRFHHTAPLLHDHARRPDHTPPRRSDSYEHHHHAQDARHGHGEPGPSRNRGAAPSQAPRWQPQHMRSPTRPHRARSDPRQQAPLTSLDRQNAAPPRENPWLPNPPASTTPSFVPLIARTQLDKYIDEVARGNKTSRDVTIPHDNDEEDYNSPSRFPERCPADEESYTLPSARAPSSYDAEEPYRDRQFSASPGEDFRQPYTLAVAFAAADTTFVSLREGTVANKDGGDVVHARNDRSGGQEAYVESVSDSNSSARKRKRFDVEGSARKKAKSSLPNAPFHTQKDAQEPQILPAADPATHQDEDATDTDATTHRLLTDLGLGSDVPSPSPTPTSPHANHISPQPKTSPLYRSLPPPRKSKRKPTIADIFLKTTRAGVAKRAGMTEDGREKGKGRALGFLERMQQPTEAIRAKIQGKSKNGKGRDL